jgi:hypothetical protein
MDGSLAWMPLSFLGRACVFFVGRNCAGATRDWNRADGQPTTTIPAHKTMSITAYH